MFLTKTGSSPVSVEDVEPVSVLSLLIAVRLSLFQAKCKVLRQFSVLGSVTVNYVFHGQTKSFSMAEGEFSKEFDVNVPDTNNNPQKDRLLYLNITSVTGSK